LVVMPIWNLLKIFIIWQIIINLLE